MRNLYSRCIRGLLIPPRSARTENAKQLSTAFKIIPLLLAMIAFFGNLQAQTITNYAFNASSGTFTAVGGTTPAGIGNVDEGYWNNIPIGFDFYYLNNRYTSVSVSTNGWITLGADITNPSPVNNLNTGGTPRPLLAPLWDDLNIQAPANFTYITSGTAPSRIFTLQFINEKWSAGAAGNTISFQVKLYETTGKIEYIYRPETGAVSAGSASIGIGATATGSGNFLSLNGTGTAPAASSTTETATLSAKPATGQTYAFAAASATTPTSLSFTSVLYNGVTLNWTDAAANETGYLIYRSTDGVNYSFVSQLAANSTSSVQTGLTASTLYYWRVYALREGSLGTALAGSVTTVCNAPAAPTVVSPVNYCQNATSTALTATGSNLVWGGVSGTVGGTSVFTSTTYADNNFSNKKTLFATYTNNLIIGSVDYYIPPYQTVTGMVLSIYNSAGTIIATSSTTTSTSAGAAAVKVTNTFNYTIAAAGDYSIGISAGTGNIGYDNPAFPITESTGLISLTGVSNAGLRCFNNVVFSTATSPTAPVPSTATTGSRNYFVSQTVGGCTSPLAMITVNVTAPNISQVPVTGLIANYPFNGNANDASVNGNPGTLQGAPTLVADRFGITGKAFNFNGSTQYISTAKPYSNPNNFTVSTWFKTSTTTGGKLIGFGIAQTGSSSQYDRHIYMNNTGQLYFGVYTGSVITVNSAASYNDNLWHLATASLSSTTGMVLYVDGVAVGSNSTTLTAENYTGYWRVAYDNNNGWTSQPSSFYFNGSLDDVLIYDHALTPAEVATIYNSPDGAGNNGPVCAGAALNLTLSATGIPGATYAWSGPNSFASTLQNPSLTFTSAAAGTYTLVVTNASGCSSTAYTNVFASTVQGQWTGNTSTDWADPANWCSGSVPTSTVNVVIASGATRMPVISTTASCNNLTINSGATLTTQASGTLNIAGTLANSGTMTNNGSTVFNGTTGQQSFTGINTFNNVTVNNSAGLILPTFLMLTGNLTLSSGILNTNNYSIFLTGNWINNASGAALNAGTSTANVNFNGTGAQTIGGTFPTTFNNIVISNTGSTVTLLANEVIGGNLTVSTGTLDLGGYTANRSTAGGTIMVDNAAFLKIGGTNTFPANYTTSNLVIAGTVEYNGTNQTISNQVYGNLKLSSAAGAAVKTMPAATMTVAGNFTTLIGAGTSLTATAAAVVNVNGNVNIGTGTTYNGASFSHNIAGNWVNNGTFNGNTGTIVFTGAGTNVSGAGAQNFNNLTVSAPSVTFAAGTVSLSGNLLTSGSGSFAQAAGGFLVMTGTSKTIAGTSISIENLTVSGTVSTANSLNLTGNLSIPGTFTASTGTIVMSGSSKTISGAGSASFNLLNITGSVVASSNFIINSGLIVDGTLSATSGTATFTGTSTLSGTANLFNSTINGTKLQLSANSNLGVASALTLTAGTLDVTSSIPNTVNFNGAAQNINAITYHNLVLSNGNTKTAVSALTLNGDLTIGTGTTFAAATYTHNIYGSWNNNGTFSPATSTIRFTGAATSFINGATTFNIITQDKSTSATTVELLSDVTAATLNMTQGLMLTGTKTMTLTVTRTGTGIILGTIRRNHAFVAGNTYTFEGPDNSIYFAAASGVNSVTVFVQKGVVSDFPSGASISRVYNITVPAGTYTATLRLHYEDNELNGNAENTMNLWNYNSSTWVVSGKTANSSTSNYVENASLTNITNRWTLSSTVSEYSWSGVIDNDWSKPGNWVYLSAPATQIPTSTDIVKIGTQSFTNQPTISTAALAKNIILGSVQAVTLSMSTGGSLITGNIAGTWSSNATHTINVNNQNITTNGDLSLSDGTAGHAINLNIGNGIISSTGTVTESGAANITFTGTGTLKIGTNFTRVDGIFTPGSGTVELNGAVNQDLGNITFNNLNINKSGGIATISQPVTINGNLDVTSGSLVNNNLTIIKGNMTTYVGGTLQNDNVLQVGGNWQNNGSYIGVGTNVVFNGAGTQTISASTFNNLEINKPVGSVANLIGDVTIKGNLVGTSGTLDIKSFFFNRDVVGGNASLADAGTLIFAADNAPNKFANYALSSNSTIIFNGTSTQHLLLPGVVYGNLTFRNAGQKILYTPITVMGKLLIESTATFDGGSNNINLYGNWENLGTFSPSTSTVVCAGTGKTLTGTTTFNKMTITGSYSILGNMTYNDLLQITAAGSLSSSTGIFTTLNGDLINNGILNTNGTTTFTGNQVQTLSLINAVATYALIVNFNGTVSPVLNSTSAPQFGYLNINNTGGVKPSIGWTIGYGLTVGTGASFILGTYSHNIYGYMTNNGTITSDGTLSFLPPVNVTVDFGTGFSSTGRVYFGGAGKLTVAGIPTNFANVNVTNTNVAGISPSSNWNMTKSLRIVSGSVFNAGSFAYLVGGNILNAGVINAGTSTFILDGSGTQELNSNSSFNNLRLNKVGDSTFFSSDIRVSGILNFIKGKITTGAYSMIMPAGGTVTGASGTTGWVSGRLRKYLPSGLTSQSFEVGDQFKYTPVDLSFASISTGGDLTVSATPGDHPALSSSVINVNKSLNRYYTLLNNGIAYTNCTAVLNFVSGDVDAGASTSAFNVSSYNGSSWILPVTGTRTSTSIQANNISLTGDIAAGEICNAGTSISYPGSPYCTSAVTAAVTITGSTGGVFSSDAGLTINSSTGLVNLAASTVGSHNVVYTIAANSDCRQFITSATIVIGVAGTWTGAQDNNWSNPNNWACGGVPTASSDVMIPNGLTTYPVITATNTIHDITIQGGASVTVTGTMQVSGKITNGGIFDISAGTIEMNGTVAQSLPATAFTNDNIANLVVSNSSAGGLTLTGKLNIYRSLTFTGTGKRLYTNDLLTLKSSAAYTAYIGDLGTNDILGQATIERYINTGLATGQHLKSWQMLSVPTNGQSIKESWMENGLTTTTPNGFGTWISGPNGTANGFDQATATPSMKYYNPVNDTWVGISNTFSVINAHQGYLVFVRGDRSVFNFSGANSAPVPTVLRTKGALNVGTQSPVTIAANKFELIGNPYAAPVDFSLLLRTGGAENQFYAWDPTLIGTYGLGGYQTIKKVGSVYTATPAAYTSGSTIYNDTSDYRVIQSGQAIFVHSTGTSGTVQFLENNKAPGNRVMLNNRFNNEVSTLCTDLLAISGSNKILADGNRIIFDDGMNNDVDGEDALKIFNGGENFGLKRNTKSLIIETRAQVGQSDTLYYEMSNLKAQPYQLMFLPKNMDPALTASLVDKWSGSRTSVNLTDTTFVTINVTSDPLSKASDRFKLVFSKVAGPLPVTITRVSATRQADQSVDVKWKVENEINIDHYTVERSNDGRTFGGIANAAATYRSTYAQKDAGAAAGDNYYRIRATGRDGKVQYSMTVKVDGAKVLPSISVYPNPVEAKTAQVRFVGEQKGNYEVRFVNNLGQVIYQSQVNVSSSNVVVPVVLPENTAAGTYQLVVVSPAGVTTNRAVLVQ